MNNKETFNRDLKIGEKEEVSILNILEDIDVFSFMSEGYFPDWDINMPIIKKTLEVKKDLKINETGNVVFEIYYKNKPSGINKSKADVWVIVNDNLVYFFQLKKLKKFLKENKHLTKEVSGGDNNWSKMLLIKKYNIITDDLCYIMDKNNIDIKMLKSFISST